MLDNFTIAVVARRDHWQTAGERFQTRIRRRIINCRQNEDVRGGVNAHQIAHFAQKLDALWFIIAPAPSTGDEQPHFAVPAQRHGSDGESQAFAFPARASEKQRGLVWLNFQFVPRCVAKLRTKTKLLEGNAVADDVNLIRGIAVKIDNLIFNHLRIGDYAPGASISE